MDNRAAMVSSLFDRFKMQLETAKASGTIEPYCTDHKTYIGFPVFADKISIQERIVQFDIARRQVAMFPNYRMLSLSSSAVVGTYHKLKFTLFLRRDQLG